MKPTPEDYRFADRIAAELQTLTGRPADSTSGLYRFWIEGGGKLFAVEDTPATRAWAYNLQRTGLIRVQEDNQ